MHGWRPKMTHAHEILNISRSGWCMEITRTCTWHLMMATYKRHVPLSSQFQMQMRALTRVGCGGVGFFGGGGTRVTWRCVHELGWGGVGWGFWGGGHPCHRYYTSDIHMRDLLNHEYFWEGPNGAHVALHTLLDKCVKIIRFCNDFGMKCRKHLGFL